MIVIDVVIGEGVLFCIVICLLFLWFGYVSFRKMSSEWLMVIISLFLRWLMGWLIFLWCMVNILFMVIWDGMCKLFCLDGIIVMCIKGVLIIVFDISSNVMLGCLVNRFDCIMSVGWVLLKLFWSVIVIMFLWFIVSVWGL